MASVTHGQVQLDMMQCTESFVSLARSDEGRMAKANEALVRKLAHSFLDLAIMPEWCRYDDSVFAITKSKVDEFAMAIASDKNIPKSYARYAVKTARNAIKRAGRVRYPD